MYLCNVFTPEVVKKATGRAIRKEFLLGGVGYQIFKKAYITRFVLDRLKPEKLQLLSTYTATIDAHGYVINVHLLKLGRCIVCISAWGQGCSF